jgi:L-ascorbate metabolism protein UlaG (beta-lactamase superfamily)
MRVTLLGHATLLVELAGATCLMDPVFFDPFEEGAVVSCPRRITHPERLPAIDILIVSHRHPDHFDIPSLARVPRDCEAICPGDPLIVYALRRLGFERVHPVQPMGEIRGADFELFPTASEITGVREFGMIFHDSSGTLWNQVDSYLSTETIAAVHRRFGRVDLLFAMYASQNFDFFDSLNARFPHETHRANLETVLRIKPGTAVPGSAGFRFFGDNAWLNAHLFPVSRERFVADLARLDPALFTQIVNPGDVLELAGEAVRCHAASSPLAAMEADDTALIRFDPTTGIPPLTDPNPDGYSPDHLKEECTRILVEGMAGYVRSGYASDELVVRAYREHRVRYAVALVFPGGEECWHCFQFEETALRINSDSATTFEADLVHRVAASVLLGWMERRKSLFYVRAYSRRHGTVCRLARSRQQVALELVPLPDLLIHYVLNVSEGSEDAARRRVDLAIEALG